MNAWLLGVVALMLFAWWLALLQAHAALTLLVEPPTRKRRLLHRILQSVATAGVAMLVGHVLLEWSSWGAVAGCGTAIPWTTWFLSRASGGRWQLAIPPSLVAAQYAIDLVGPTVGAVLIIGASAPILLFFAAVVGGRGTHSVPGAGGAWKPPED